MTLAVDGAYDLRASLRPLCAGPRDPTWRLGRDEAVHAVRTPRGPATWHARHAPGRGVEVRAWGPGADWALERLPDWLGLRDVPPPLPDAGLCGLARRARGVRLPRGHGVVETLVPIVLAQLVSGREAERSFARLVRRFSQPAPGPVADLWLPPGPEALRAIPGWAFGPLGIGARQAGTLREVAARAGRLERLAQVPPEEAERRLCSVPGIGPWTARRLLLHGLGAPDAVPVGDHNLPHAVAFTLAGEPRADDARMLELLEPWRGQRGRVVRWVMAAGRFPPRRGPRRALRPLPRWPRA